MDGILNAIRSTFGFGNKQEPIPAIPHVSQPPLPNALFNNVTPAAQSAQLNSPPTDFSIKKIGGDIGNGLHNIFDTIVKPVEDYFAPTPDVRARDVIRELPGAAAQMTGDILRAPLRALASVSGTGTNKVYTPTTPGEKFVYGDEPIKPLDMRIKEATPAAEGTVKFFGGSDKTAKQIGVPLAALGVTGSTALDILPLPEGKAKPKISTIEEAATVLKNELKINPIDMTSELAGPAKVPIQDAIKLLTDGFDVSKDILNKLKKGVVMEGDNVVMQGQGDNLLVSIGNEFKDVLPTIGKKVKQVAEQINKPQVTAEPWRIGSKDIPENLIKEGQTNIMTIPGVTVPEDAKLMKEGTGVLKGEAPTKSQVNSLDQEAEAYLKSKYDLKTPGQYSKQQVAEVAANEKAKQALDKEAEASFQQELGLLSNKGKGDLSIPAEVFSDAPKWNDKTGVTGMFRLNRETPQRVIEDVIPNKKVAQEVIDFLPAKVADNERLAQNWMSEVKKNIDEKIIKGLGIKPGSLEDQMVMSYGEGRTSLDDLKAVLPNNWQNVVEADKFFRSFYDDTLNRINEVITKYGYEPVAKRQNYYTHYQELGNVFANIGALLKGDALPRDLAGLTADFKPGKQFFKFGLQRMGGDFTESAIGAVDQYLRPAANQIFHTDSAQRGRTLIKVLDESLAKNKEVDSTHLSHFMGWLRDYVNTIAGKKTMMARGTEGVFGREGFSLITAVKQQTSANLVAGNVASALSNFVPLTQAIATTDKPSFVKGLVNTVTNPLLEENNYMIDGVQSSFLRRRFPSEGLVHTMWQEIPRKLNWLFETADKFVANTLVAGKYFEGLKNGSTPEVAMKAADEYASRIMADRSFGQSPQLFQNQGILGLLTQFQLEVNNQVSFMFKDIPRASEGDKAKVASTLAQIFIYSYLFNNVFEFVSGRRPAFDPIGTVINSIQTAVDPKLQLNQKIPKIARFITNQLPFLSTFTGGGRIPLSSGLPTVDDILNDPGKAIRKTALTYLTPGGGSQIEKVIEGLEAYIRGYEKTPAGRVKYPIKQTIGNAVRAVAFGKSAFPETQQYYNTGGQSLGKAQSRRIVNLPADQRVDYYTKIMDVREAKAVSKALKEAKKTSDASSPVFKELFASLSPVGKSVAKIELTHLPKPTIKTAKASTPLKLAKKSKGVNLQTIAKSTPPPNRTSIALSTNPPKGVNLMRVA